MADIDDQADRNGGDGGEGDRTAGGGTRERPLSRSLRTTLTRAVDEAQRRGSTTVEAEHLLLALALDRHTPVQRALAAAGLDHAGVEEALRAEREAALRAAGVEPIREDRLRAARRLARPRWGASAREALVAAHRVAADRGGRVAHTAESDLLAGILGLQLGTVPRALALARTDRAALRDAALRRAAGPGDAPGAAGVA